MTDRRWQPMHTYRYIEGQPLMYACHKCLCKLSTTEYCS